MYMTTLCVQDEKYTPLHVAAHNGHVQAVETLLKLGADVDAITQVHWMCKIIMWLNFL